MWSSLDVPDDAKSPLTDYTHWRLNVTDGGGHTWEYLHSEEACAQRPQSDVEKFWLGLPLNLPSLLPAKDALEAARNGFIFYKHLQAQDGHWPGVYDGPMFLLPGLVISNYVTGASFKMEERLEMVRYLLNKANTDGGWGIHIEGPSTCFGTALNYVVMRLLGVRAEHTALVKARGALHKLGGAAAVPAWGKFWLSVLNVYDWAGNHCIPGELWLLPEWLPFHPHRWWIHTRNVYIPMAFLYGVRFKAKEDELILALREELYVQSYDAIDWPAQRNNVAAIDTYVPHHPLLNFAYHFLNAYEACAPSFIRKASLAKLYELIVMEDENTAYQTLGPVSKTINMVARYHMEGSESDAFKQHLIKQNDFMWVCPQGLMMSGTNGSQLWDLAFITQAVVEGGMASDEENKECFVKVLTWFDECQIKDNPKHYEKAFRHATKGAWPFSTREQSYVVSDCTGEGLKAVLYLQNLSYMKEVIPKRRLCDAVDVMLSLQNKDGGFASYELVRGPKWLEMLNCAEVFGNIMIEYCYPECTTSVITALAIFRKHYPDYRSGDIDQTINAAIHYLHETQRPEGGWFGSWGICFTYATQFALESLSLVGETYATSESVRRACAFLISKQREDGGWGESYKACELEVWVDHEQSQVVNTSWAAMALMYAQYPKREPIERAVRLVMSRQLPDGSWAQEGIEGIFNKTCAIAYPNFKFAFTIWMLGMAHKYLAKFQTVS